MPAQNARAETSADPAPEESPEKVLRLRELDLQERQVTIAERQAQIAEKDSRVQRWAQGLAALSVIAALASVGITSYYSHQNAKESAASVRLSSQQAEFSAEQTDEAQISTAITNINGGNSQDRVVRINLLAKDVGELMNLALPTADAKQSALTNFQIVVNVLASYIHEHSPSRAAEYHEPPRGITRPDVSSAISSLGEISRLERQARAAGSHFSPVLNLLAVDLQGADLEQANFGWFDAILSDSDLREANFSYANLDGVAMVNSVLSCSDMASTSMVHSNLTDATISNVNIQGANLYRAVFNDAVRFRLIGQPIHAPANFYTLPTLKRPVPFRNPCL